MNDFEENKVDYREFVEGPNRQKFESRLNELIKSANSFIHEAGYTGCVECNERIMLNVQLDYYADIYRLKGFHGIEWVRTEKIVAYTVAWIVKRKPLQFVKYCSEEKDIFVNERFAAYLMINECMANDGKKYVSHKNQAKLDEYLNLVLYYLKYRSCNPQVIELAIESFKMGMLMEN